jgi:hypothetical protein
MVVEESRADGHSVVDPQVFGLAYAQTATLKKALLNSLKQECIPQTAMFWRCI